MKKLAILLVLAFYVLFSPDAKSQNLGTENFLNFGSKGWETVSAMATDKDGNYYVTGTFSEKLYVNGNILESSGQRDIFLIKYSNNYQFLWAKNYGGELDDNVYSITCSSSGNLYLAGSLKGTINLDKPLTAQVFTDAFYMKLDNSGQVLQSKVLASKSSAKKVIIRTDTAENVWLAGSFAKTLELGAGTVLQSPLGTDIFFAKYSTDGNLLLHKQIGGEGNENLKAFILDNENNLFLGGSYSSNIMFGDSTASNYEKQGLFVAKYDSTETPLWYKTAGGSLDAQVVDLAIDTHGNLYIAGDFTEHIQIEQLSLDALKEKDAFLIRASATDGEFIWTKQLGSNSYNTLNSVIVANNNHVYIAGNFIGKLQTETESVGKSADVYIARYDTTGTKEWVSSMGGNPEDNLLLSYNTTDSSLYAYGYFSENIEFLNQSITAKNYKDIYLGAIIDCQDVSGLNLGNDTTLCSGQSFTANGDYTNYLWEHGVSTLSIVPEQTNTYRLTVTDIYGCQSTDDVFITVIESPVVDLGTDIIAPATDSIVLGTAGSYPAYLWTTDETTATITIQMAQFTYPSIVGLTVEAANGCTASDDILISQEPAPPISAVANNSSAKDGLNTSSEKNKLKSDELKNEEKTLEEKSITEYKIYPNPTAGTFFISLAKPELVKQVDIFDSKGNHINHFKNIERNQLEIDVSSYPKGIYLIYITEEIAARVFKLAVE